MTETTMAGMQQTIQTVPAPTTTISVLTTRKFWSKINYKKLIKKRIPILNWLPQYTIATFFQDVLAGLTVGMTEIPQGIAYAIVAGTLPKQYRSFKTRILSCRTTSRIRFILGADRRLHLRDLWRLQGPQHRSHFHLVADVAAPRHTDGSRRCGPHDFSFRDYYLRPRCVATRYDQNKLVCPNMKIPLP